MRFISILLAFFIVLPVKGILKKKLPQFTVKSVVAHLPVKDQGRTGTCWSFATTSFLESEIIRKGYPHTDLSEMFFVYYSYLDKAKMYLLYHSKNNFGQGGQAHDVINVLKMRGMVPYSDFPGVMINGCYQHNELSSALRKEVKTLDFAEDGFSVDNMQSVEKLLQKYIGRVPKNIKTKNEKLSPIDYRNSLGIDPNDYIELTSFSHHPYYNPFVLEVPDNWSHALYYNIPVDELVETMVYALNNGYTICWDGDTSEEKFLQKEGIACMTEEKITQQMRQIEFFNRETTDDHLMHIVGLSEDRNGNRGFYTKNSWGDKSNTIGGYLHITEDYVRLKTIAILVNKSAIPLCIKKKLKL